MKVSNCGSCPLYDDFECHHPESDEWYVPSTTKTKTVLAACPLKKAPMIIELDKDKNL